MVTVREAREADVESIRELFVLAYGQQYAYPIFYNLDSLKKLIYADTTLLLVAEQGGQLLGTASVVMHVGSYNDLVGEFGRLVVHPDARGQGIGNLLMQGRIERVRERLHVGLVENRTVHDFSQRIAAKHGFACAGFLPAKLLTDRRENLSLYVCYFGDALNLRSNHPHIIPEVLQLAELSMRNLGLTPDLIVDVGSPAYLLQDEFRLEEFQTEGYASLLRLERGRVHQREIVGPLRLHYGLFQLRARDSTYLIARHGERLAGAVGFACDKGERAVRVFELISDSDQPIRFLLENLLKTCGECGDIDYIEVDVNAHSPRMQRTLLELGFLPCAYVPALTFHQVERLDVVKFSWLRTPPDFSQVCLAEPSERLAQLVMAQFERAQVVPEILAAATGSRLFEGLSKEQTDCLAREFELRQLPQHKPLFAAGEAADGLYLLVDGEVEILANDDSERIVVLGRGACVGERALLTQLPHSVAARADGPTQLGVLTRTRLENLVRRRPDVGLVLYRNLAIELANKLR